MTDKGVPENIAPAVHDLIFQVGVGASPWWQEITAEHQWDKGGKAPGHWSYRLVSGNPYGNGRFEKSIGFDQVNNMIRTIAAGTYPRELHRLGTAPSSDCRKACMSVLRDLDTAQMTAGEGDEVLQMIMFGEVLFGLDDVDRVTSEVYGTIEKN